MNTSGIRVANVLVTPKPNIKQVIEGTPQISRGYIRETHDGRWRLNMDTSWIHPVYVLDTPRPRPTSDHHMGLSLGAYMPPMHHAMASVDIVWIRRGYILHTH